MKKVLVLYPFKNSSYQFFLQNMAEALIHFGFQKINGIRLKWKFRLIIGKLSLSCNIHFMTNFNKAIIILGAGYIDSFAFPFGYTNEIIPILWDTWPKYWKRIIASFKRHNIKIAFFTQRQVAEYIGTQLPTVKCYYLPEAIAAKGYKRGGNLLERHIDLLELGRIYMKYHNLVLASNIPALKKHMYQHTEDELLFNDFEELTGGLADSKITICFPRCITHPEHAGNVETLTQRYWECMLSRTVILGHAPDELLDVLGYNPVIEIAWENVSVQINDILTHISVYQTLVDKNYYTALKFGLLETRMPFIKQCLCENGYYI